MSWETACDTIVPNAVRHIYAENEWIWRKVTILVTDYEKLCGLINAFGRIYERRKQGGCDAPQL